jgi:hypothetical protein
MTVMRVIGVAAKTAAKEEGRNGRVLHPTTLCAHLQTIRNLPTASPRFLAA